MYQQNKFYIYFNLISLPSFAHVFVYSCIAKTQQSENNPKESSLERLQVTKTFVHHHQLQERIVIYSSCFGARTMRSCVAE